MRDLHIVMPMAGRGSRFADAGFTTPKPLVEVDGRAMFLKALTSLDNIAAKKSYTVIIRKQHDTQYGLKALLQRALNTVNVVVTDEDPRGATVDALRAQRYLKELDGVIVMDCDLWFRSLSYDKMVEDSLKNLSDIAGGLLTFQSDNPRYSYAKFDSDGIVTETAEKRVISNHAITGAYYFSTAAHFINAANKLLQRPLNPEMPEYYLSHLYNILIGDEKRVQVAYVDSYASFGTPEELALYCSTN